MFLTCLSLYFEGSGVNKTLRTKKLYSTVQKTHQVVERRINNVKEEYYMEKLKIMKQRNAIEREKTKILGNISDQLTNIISSAIRNA